MGSFGNDNPKKKRILVISQHFWPEDFRINDLCRGFVEQGYSVDVVCGIPNYPSGKVFKGWGAFERLKEVWNGINIRRIWEIPRGSNKLWRILINFVSWPFFCLFYLPFIRGKYECVLSYQLTPVLIAFPAIVYCFFTKIPLYIYVLDYWPYSVFAVVNIKNRFLRKLLFDCSKWHYKKADGVICASEGIKNGLINEMGIDPERTVFIPQTCEKIHEAAVRDKAVYDKYGSRFCIVFTGSINPTSSFDIIVSAAKMCYSAGYNNINWVIVGDGMSKDAAEALVNKAGLSDVFHFEGRRPVEDMPKYYDIADAFIVALSKSQVGDITIPAKVQSYFAAGKPVIGAMDSEGRTIINENRAGYCGPADDVHALYENICKIYLLSDGERAEMGARAKQYYFKHFEREAQLKKFIDFFNIE